MKLNKIYSNIIPFEGYIALTVWPWVFIRKDLRHKYTETTDRHEHTHGYQQIECLILGAVVAAILFIVGCGWWSLLALTMFFWLYLTEWIIKIPVCVVTNMDAYYSISFEQEAYDHEAEIGYHNVRKPFAWTKYIFKLNKRRRV